MARALCAPSREQYGHRLSSAQLRELEAEFQAIIDSKADNAARRCASLCLAREEVAAEEERHRQLRAFAGCPQADAAPRQPWNQRPAPAPAVPAPTPVPAPRLPPTTAPQAWTFGFFDEKTRAISSAAGAEPVASKESSASPAAPAEDGDSSDEDYERILVSAFALKDKVHTLLQEEGRRKAAATAPRRRAQPRCDMRTILEMSQCVQERYAENERNEADSSTRRRPRPPPPPAHSEHNGGGGGAGGPPTERPATPLSASSAARRAAASNTPPASAAPSTPRLALPIVTDDFHWEPLGPCVCFQFALRNVDFAWLSTSPSLVGNLEAGIKDAISEAALGKVQPSRIRLLMNAGPAGSVTVKVTTTPSEGVEAEDLRLALSDTAALADAVLKRVGTTHGIGSATTGSLAVGQVAAPCVQEQPPSGTTPPPTLPLWTTMSTSSPGSSAGVRPALVERKAANEDLGKELAELAAQLRRSNIIGGMDALID